VYLLSMNAEARSYYWTLPEHIRLACVPNERISRQDVLELTTRARVMLAPSLVDGVPNSMYEAMAAGAVPIVSPLETIRTVVEDERNVLFARNLYPDEIATALTRAMTDDALVDRMAQGNLDLVKRIANRRLIQPRVIRFYEELAAQK
jgi:glycosyltransferase involved in cell wall biosynthesis